MGIDGTRKRFKSRKLKLVNLGEDGESIGKEIITGYSQPPEVDIATANSITQKTTSKNTAGSKRKLPSDEPTFPTYEPLEEQKWSWSAEGMTDWFDFSKMVHQLQKQGGYDELKFVQTKDESTGKHRSDILVASSGLTQNTAFSAESAQDATEKAAQMNLFIHDAFPVPPTGEHEVWAGINFSKSRIPPQFTFKRWLVSHLLDQVTNTDSFKFPMYTRTMKTVVNASNQPTGIVWYATVNVNDKEYSSGGEERLFEDGKVAENCAALEALIQLGLAKQQDFEYSRLVLPKGSKLRDPDTKDKVSIQKFKKSVPKSEPTGEVTLDHMNREAYVEKLKEDLTKYSRKKRCPPPEMFTTNNPDGSFTSTVTVNWINYTGHHPSIDKKAMTQAAEMALFQLKLLKKEDSRYLKTTKQLDRAQQPLLEGPSHPALMRGGHPQAGPIRGGPRHGPPPPGAFARGRGMPGMRGMPPHGPRGMLARGMPARGMPARGMPTRGMPTRGMPARGMPGRGMPTRGMPTRGMPTRGMPARGMPTRGARGGMPRGAHMGTGYQPKPPAGLLDPSTVTWATVKQHLAQHLQQQGENLPTYSVGMSEQGLYTAIATFHYLQPRSYTGRQQYTKIAAEQDAAELGLVGIGYLPRRVLGDQPPVPHAPPAQPSYSVSYG